tara:strand:- start:4669 stop:5358 length:690 start_codon:yes stop_codon:yes gene_type:complete
MKIIIISLFTSAFLISQSYTVSIFGIPAVDVDQKIDNQGEIIFSTQNRGIFDTVWPAKNKYTTKYNPKSFELIQWGKRIRQGSFKTNHFAKLDSNNFLIYNNKTKIKVKNETLNIFSLIAIVQNKSFSELDTKWFNYEHEGQIGKARFVWADSVNLYWNKDSIMCDHFRLDLKITDRKGQFLNKTDYFMNEIINENLVREIWVKQKEPKKIVQASIQYPFMTVMAILNE